MDLSRYNEKTNIILQELAIELGPSCDEGKAWRILQSVLHALRRRLTLEESFDLMSQLPLLLKGVYVDGWNPRDCGIKMRTVDEFIECVRWANKHTASRDLGNDTEAKSAIEAVFRVLKNHVSAGEASDIKGTLPSHLSEFWAMA
jgi:uncharacterized protein (DUF2267 family)